MLIKVESSGGFAGITKNLAEYDTADLTEAQAARVQAALTDVAAAEDGEIGADLAVYRVTVDGDREYTLTHHPAALDVLMHP